MANVYQTRIVKIDDSNNVVNVTVGSTCCIEKKKDPSNWIVGYVCVDENGEDVQPPYPADKFYNPPRIGGTWDPTNQAFINDQSFSSWSLSTTTYQWSAPVGIPTDAIENGGTIRYDWDEDNTSWATN